MAHHFVLSVLVCGFIALLLVTDSSSLAGSSQSKIQLNLTWSANISEMYPPRYNNIMCNLGINVHLESLLIQFIENPWTLYILYIYIPIFLVFVEKY